VSGCYSARAAGIASDGPREAGEGREPESTSGRVSGARTEAVVEEDVQKISEKALRMLKHMRMQIFRHPARYVVVREGHGDNPAAPRGSLCSDLR